MLSKLLFWLSVLALPTSAAFAQTKPKPLRPASKPETLLQMDPQQAPDSLVTIRADALTGNMTQALGLSPAQVEKVRAINLHAVRVVETARLNHADEPGKLRTYIESVGITRLERLKDVLTAAQFNKYQQKREQKMGIPTVRGGIGIPAPGLKTGRGDE